MDSRSRPSRTHAPVSYEELSYGSEEEGDIYLPDTGEEASSRRRSNRRSRSRLRRKGTPRYSDDVADDSIVNPPERTRSGRQVRRPTELYRGGDTETSPVRSFSHRMSKRRSERRSSRRVLDFHERDVEEGDSEEEDSDEDDEDRMSFDEEEHPSQKRLRTEAERYTVRRGGISDRDNIEDQHDEDAINSDEEDERAIEKADADEEADGEEAEGEPNKAADDANAMADEPNGGDGMPGEDGEASKEAADDGAHGAPSGNLEVAAGSKKSIKLRVRVKPIKAPNGGNADSADSEEPIRRTRSDARRSNIPAVEKHVIAGGDDDGDDDFKPKSDDESNEEDSGAEEVVPSTNSSDDGVRTRLRKRRAAPAPAKRPRRETRSSAPSRPLRSSSRYRNARHSAPQRPARRSERRPAARNTASRRDALDSYRPSRARNTPRDFYLQESSSDSSSSEDEFLGARAGNKVSSPRAPAAAGPSTGAGAPDFFANPMATADDGNRRNPNRYARRRNRNQKAGIDPFAGDKHGKARMPRNIVGIEPIQVDLSLKWEDIGGLDHHIRALKEMVFLPLMYPEIFQKFDMEPPKGVLFYGPPGTGKTLCARTLAASCGGDPVEAAAKPNASAVHEALKAAKQTATNSVAPAPDGFIVGAKEGDGAAGIAVEGADGGTAAADAVKNNPALQQAAAALLTPSAAEKPADPTAAGADPKPTGATKDAGDEEKKARRPRVAFFMRNGADCLSKWVGEAERQLRMTFEAAKQHQPAIIFFDEIDGLAPVRSSRQDQIHSSIVSTLLGLMDGLDSRGKIVVIGATNRVDAIDPALRRPGRFDRELIFTLPNGKARRRILEIQTASWKPKPPAAAVLDAVAERTVGYCGADLKALCAEATLRAVRRRYPQIYNSQDKLLIKVDEVRVSKRDFSSAMNDIVPASHRSARAYASPLPKRLEAVLKKPMEKCLEIIERIFPQGIPPALRKMTQPVVVPNGVSPPAGVDDDDDSNGLSDGISDDDFDEKDFDSSLGSKGRSVHGQSAASLHGRPVLRPRLLVCGRSGLGQMQLGPALLHFLEGCPVHSIDMASLHMNSSARTAEEALVTAVREACRAAPSVLYLPHFDLWWKTAPEPLQTTLTIALRDIPADLPLFFLATADEPFESLPKEITDLVGDSITLEPSGKEDRERMFAPIVEGAREVPKVSEAMLRRKRKQRREEVLPKAPPAPAVVLSEKQTIEKSREDDMYIRTLRMEMREFVEKQLRDRKFKAFWTPVQPSEAPDYYKIVRDPMDLSKIAAQVDKGMYPTVASMVRDFDLMFKNAIDYNPAHTEEGAAIIRRAHGLVDIVHAWVDNLDPAIVERCNAIVAGRLREHAARMEREARKKAAEERAAEGEKTPAADGNGDVSMADVEKVGEAVAEKMDVDKEDGATRADEPGNSVRLPPRRISNDAPTNGERDEDGLSPKKIRRVSPLFAANGCGVADGGREATGDGKGAKDASSDAPVVGAESPAAPAAPAGNAEASVNAQPTVNLPVEKDKSMPEEPRPKLADESKVNRLRRMLAEVSSGITVDGLERLHVRCGTLLHTYRRSVDRAAVVEEVTRTVEKARDDPAIVGDLVE